MFSVLFLCPSPGANKKATVSGGLLGVDPQGFEP